MRALAGILADDLTSAAAALCDIEGASARCIVTHLTGGDASGDYPMDADDFARCVAVLDRFPALRIAFPAMQELNAYWHSLVPRWAMIEANSPARRTALIRDAVSVVEANDPAVRRIGRDTLLRVGGFPPSPFKDGKAMKHDPDFHDAARHANAVTAAELRQFIERWEQLQAEKADVAQQQKDVMSEAKVRGYDTRVMRKVIALRKRKPDEVAEEEAVLELYKSALGMD